MRILVISDTHGNENNLKKILKREGNLDHVLHLGDVERGEERIARLVGCPMDIVAGNCDFFSKMPRVKFLELDGCRIMMTHGHYYYVTAGLRDLILEAKANDCDVVMFGHTHMPFLNQEDGQLTVLNPGSISFPRQEGRNPSYIIMETTGTGRAQFEIRYLQ